MSDVWTDDARPLVLGIDPGGATDHTGLCFTEPARKGLDLHRLDFLAAVALITARAPEIAVAVLEDARSLPLYHRHRSAPREARDRIARSVGQVDAHTADFAALLDSLSIPYVLRQPKPGEGKWDGRYFVHVTRYEGETCQHTRDACRLVFGFSRTQLLREAERQAATRRAPAGSSSPPLTTSTTT